jgi:uncharacterized OsmC-like protein
VADTARLLEDDPTAGHVRPLVKTTLVHNVHARSDFIQYGKEFSFECDESDGRAGTSQAPSPLRYFLSSIAFCQQVWFAKGAALAGVVIEELEIDVHTYMDMRGEHKVGEVPPNPQWIIIEANVTSPSATAAVLAMADEAKARCPVTNLIAKAVPVYEQIRLKGAVIRDTVPARLGEQS